MPELPEVEAARRAIASTALHQAVARVEVQADEVLAVSPQKLWSNVSGHSFEKASCLAEHVFIRLDNDKIGGKNVSHDDCSNL